MSAGFFFFFAFPDATEAHRSALPANHEREISPKK